MTFKYDLQAQNAAFDRSEQKYYAHAVKQGDVYLPQIIEEIQQRTSLSAGDVANAVRSLSDLMLEHLSQGERVHLGELGSFFVQLSSKAMTSPDQFRRAQIGYKGVNYHPSKEMVRTLKYTPLEHSHKVLRFRVSKAVSIEELRRKVHELLAREKRFTRVQYMRFTGQLAHKAQQDLRLFVAEGWLEKVGSRPQVYYRAKKQE